MGGSAVEGRGAQPAGEPVVRRAAEARLRDLCDVAGTVASVTRATGPLVALDVVVADASGRVRCHFAGRDAIPGVVVGTRLRVRGRLVTYRSRRCLLNPSYELVGACGAAGAESS